MKLKINFDWGPYKEGTILDVPDKKGIPLDIYWRNRLKDSQTDNCVSVVKEKKVKTKTSQPSGEEK